MFQKALGGVLFVMAVAAAAGCGGFSEEKATARCDQEQYAKSQCVTDAAYAECIACYKECGESCQALASCPEAYTCDDSSDSNGDGDTTSAQ